MRVRVRGCSDVRCVLRISSSKDRPTEWGWPSGWGEPGDMSWRAWIVYGGMSGLIVERHLAQGPQVKGEPQTGAPERRQSTFACYGNHVVEYNSLRPDSGQVRRSCGIISQVPPRPRSRWCPLTPCPQRAQLYPYSVPYSGLSVSVAVTWNGDTMPNARCLYVHRTCDASLHCYSGLASCVAAHAFHLAISQRAVEVTV